MQIAIALGSNIYPEKNLQEAADLLRKQWPDIRFSHVYRTAPRDDENQKDFLNAVAIIETTDGASYVLSILQDIEHSLGKNPPHRFGPRTIDLDLLLYGDERIRNADVEIPHPRMHERRFVLEPLVELVDAEEMHPVQRMTWAELLKKAENQRCERVEVVL